MPITRSQRRSVIPSPEPPAKRTRSHTIKDDSLNSAKKSRISHGNSSKTAIAISPEDTATPRGVTLITSAFGGLDDSFRIDALETKVEPLPPGVIDIFARDPFTGVLTSKPGPSRCFLQCDSFRQGLLSHLHMTHYGRDYLLLVRGQESRESRDLGKIPTAPLRHRISPLTRARTPQFHQEEDSSATSEDLSENLDSLEEDEENDITSDEGEMRTHCVSRYRPRNDVSNRLPYQPELTVQMRRVLVQWMSEVVKEFKLSEATYHLAVTLIDQLLARGPGGSDPALATERSSGCTFSIHRNEFQAFGW